MPELEPETVNVNVTVGCHSALGACKPSTGPGLQATSSNQGGQRRSGASTHMCHRPPLSRVPSPDIHYPIIPSCFPWASDETHLCERALIDNIKKIDLLCCFLPSRMSFIWASWPLGAGPSCLPRADTCCHDKTAHPSGKQPSLSDEACTCLVAPEIRWPVSPNTVSIVFVGIALFLPASPRLVVWPLADTALSHPASDLQPAEISPPKR